MRKLPSVVRPLLLGVAVLALSTTGSYLASSKVIRGRRPAGLAAQTDQSKVFPTGDYLVIYVLLSSECGLCTEAKARAAIAALRDSVLATNSGRYVAVRVVGVSVDNDLGKGIRYLTSFKPPFDQLVVGGSWLNEVMSSMAWRDHIATTQIPQILAFQRKIDATGYPRDIIVQPDSLVLRFAGRDSLIAWVNSGAPANWRGR